MKLIFWRSQPVNEINIIVDGQERQDFINIVVTKSMETFAGTFSFQATSTKNIQFPLRQGSSCEILVNQVRVINGFIEKLRITYKANKHNIHIRGRDKTGDIIDSTLGDGDVTEFNAKNNSVSLKQIAEKILQRLNIQNVAIIDNVGIKPFTQDHLSVEIGTSGFDFLQKYAQKRQVLLTTNGNGDIVFTRTPTETYKTQLILTPNAPSTILEADVNFDDTKRFNKYFCSSQGNPSGVSQYFTTPDKTANTAGESDPDNEIRKSRIYHFETDFSAEDETAKQRANWEANFRRTQAKQWIYTVRGYNAEDDKKIWEPLKFVNVNDSLSNTNARLLIAAVTYTANLGEGSKTILKLVTEDAFSLQVEKPVKNKDASQEGLDFFITPPSEETRRQEQNIVGGDQ